MPETPSPVPSILGTFAEGIQRWRAMRVLEVFSSDLYRAGWYVRSVSVNVRGPKLMFESPWADRQHVATISLELYAGVKGKRQWHITHETCDMGPETTELYKRFYAIVKADLLRFL